MYVYFKITNILFYFWLFFVLSVKTITLISLRKHYQAFKNNFSFKKKIKYIKQCNHRTDSYLLSRNIKRAVILRVSTVALIRNSTIKLSAVKLRRQLHTPVRSANRIRV